MIKRLLFLSTLALSITSCDKSTDDNIDNTPTVLTENYLLGNPSKATKVVSNTDNYLLEKSQYVMSYNNTYGRANWVSWHLSAEWLGSTDRSDDFRPDADLPSGYYKAGSSAFLGSGFDRGHLCPSGDRTANRTDNSATFVMSNMSAQAPKVNQGNWANLENYCRQLASKGNELYIIAGGYGEGGSGSNGGTTKTLDNGRVRVPSNCWKVIVVLPNGTDDVNRITETTRVIAINIPNKQSAGDASWGTYRTTVRDLESKTGFDFLSQLPKAIQDVIENKVDNGPTG